VSFYYRYYYTRFRWYKRELYNTVSLFYDYCSLNFCIMCMMFTLLKKLRHTLLKLSSLYYRLSNLEITSVSILFRNLTFSEFVLTTDTEGSRHLYLWRSHQNTTLLLQACMKVLVRIINWWKGKPSGSIACTRKQQPRFYWSCSSVVINDVWNISHVHVYCKIAKIN